MRWLVGHRHDNREQTSGDFFGPPGCSSVARATADMPGAELAGLLGIPQLRPARLASAVRGRAGCAVDVRAATPGGAAAPADISPAKTSLERRLFSSPTRSPGLRRTLPLRCRAIRAWAIRMWRRASTTSAPPRPPATNHRRPCPSVRCARRACTGEPGSLVLPSRLVRDPVLDELVDVARPVDFSPGTAPLVLLYGKMLPKVMHYLR